MYVRVTPGRYDPTREDAVQRLVTEQIIPAITRLAGFQRYEGGVDRTAGRVVTITLWETEEQAQGLREALRDLVPQMEAAGLALEASQVYEVIAQA